MYHAWSALCEKTPRTRTAPLSPAPERNTGEVLILPPPLTRAVTATCLLEMEQPLLDALLSISLPRRIKEDWLYRPSVPPDPSSRPIPSPIRGMYVPRCSGVPVRSDVFFPVHLRRARQHCVIVSACPNPGPFQRNLIQQCFQCRFRWLVQHASAMPSALPPPDPSLSKRNWNL